MKTPKLLTTLSSTVFLYTLLSTAVVHAATYWVDPTGNDSNSCASISGSTDPGQFRQTIKGGAACLSAGDTLKVKAGTYVETLTNLLPSGRSVTQPTVIEGVTSGTSIVTSSTGNILLFNANKSNIVIRRLVLDGRNRATSAIRTNSANVINNLTIEENEIKNMTDIGIVLGDGVTNSLIRNNVIHDIHPTSGRHCIYLRATNTVVEYNECYKSPVTGITVYSSGPGGTRNTLRYNYFHQTGYNTATKGPGNGIDDRAINISKSNTLVHDNIITNNTDHGIMVTSGTGIKIFNNTIYGNGRTGIKINLRASGVEVTNNISFGNHSLNISDSSLGASVQGNVTTDPLFVDPANNNFRLKAGSAATNKGAAINVITKFTEGPPKPDVGTANTTLDPPTNSKAATQ